jgi:hypothetical protein
MHNIIDIIEILKSMELNKCLFKCFIWFFKVRWVQENQVVMFLMVWPKDGFDHKIISNVTKKSLCNWHGQNDMSLHT